MRQKLTFCAVALASTCLLSPAAMAQDSSSAPATAGNTYVGELTLGTQWVGGSNTGQYGRYNGFTDRGADMMFGFNFQKRDPWDSGNTFYYKFTGLNLDFQIGNQLARNFTDDAFTSLTSSKIGPEASLSLEFGNQGSWGVKIDYDAITYTGNIINSIYTVNGETGTLNGIAAYGGASNSPSTKGTVTAFTPASLSHAEMPFQTGTRRDAVQVAGKVEMGEWTFNTSIRHEHKEGTLEESLRETYGGQAFTLPVDFDTDRFDLSATYVDPEFQAVIQYVYSRFADNNTGVTLPYPVYKALSSSSGPYAQSGLYSTPPSTSAHYITVMLADKISPKTRISLDGRVGVELQDSTFPANSADPNLSNTMGNPTYTWFNNLNSMNQGTSATSPDAAAWVYQGKLAVSSNLATDLDGSASYSVDGRSVHLNQYQVWIGGSSPDAAATTAAYVVPQSWFKQTAKVEVGYRILPASNTKLTASYSFNNTNRSNAQVEHSITNSESLELSSMLGSDLLGRLTYAHGDRTGSLVYGRAWGNLETGSPEEFDTPSGAYYQAPMTSDAVTARVDYAPTGDFSGGVYLKYVNEDYHYPAVPSTAPSGDWNLTGYGQGIKQDYNFTAGPDVNYRPSETVNLHVYYTYEQIYFDNRGNGACAESNTGTCAGSVGYFQNKYTSSTNTAGLSGDWQASDKLKLSADYNMSTGSVIFGQYNGVLVSTVTQSYQNVVSYPDVNSTMHDLRLTAVYHLSEKIQCSLMYEFSMFHNNDWSDLSAPIVPTTNGGTAISILSAGYSAPNYNVSTVGAVFKVML